MQNESRCYGFSLRYKVRMTSSAVVRIPTSFNTRRVSSCKTGRFTNEFGLECTVYLKACLCWCRTSESYTLNPFSLLAPVSFLTSTPCVGLVPPALPSLDASEFVSLLSKAQGRIGVSHPILGFAPPTPLTK